MIHIKTPEELAKMREAGRIVALAHDAVRTSIRAGMTSRELNAICERVITEAGATPSFKGLYGFPLLHAFRSMTFWCTVSPMIRC